MEWKPAIPAPLCRAQVSLEGVEGATILETLAWNDRIKKWTIKFRVQLGEGDSAGMLTKSDWFLVIDNSYPSGKIDVYPAKHNGIVGTYHHQRYNHEGDPALPWRAGNICTNTQSHSLGRIGNDVEPFASEERLLWHCKRALDWVRCARNGELVIPGEPFELPLHNPSCERKNGLIFCEGSLSSSPWAEVSDTCGAARLFNSKNDENAWFTESFHGATKTELHLISWGRHVTRCRGNTWHGAWLRLPGIPTSTPYRFPETWGELRQALSDQGLNLKDAIRSVAKPLRDGEEHFLLIGFPIPEVFEEQPVQMHWIAIVLPPLSRKREYPSGFRANDQGFLENDMRTRFSQDERLIYMSTQNWHSDQIQRRGSYPEMLRSRRIAVIGCGALGAPIAEMLVRGGVHNITLFDGEEISIGNLTRHTLSMIDMNDGKAKRLADRLNSLSPHAEVEFVGAHLSAHSTEAMESLLTHDVVLDCTGSDEALRCLATAMFSSRISFVSISMGFRAKRLFLFHAQGTQFPEEEFYSKVRPWLEAEQEEFQGERFPREGTGCYDPVFPARCDETWMWSSFVVNSVSKIIEQAQEGPELRVFEQKEDEYGCLCVCRAEEALVLE